MPRVLVLGGAGMLGQAVVSGLSRCPGVSVVSTRRGPASDPRTFDVESGAGALESILGREGPFDYAINCIGVLKAHIDEQASESVRRAIVVNAVFPHELAAVAGRRGVRVIHMSTDGVFAGNAGAPYFEDAPHDCPDVYGKTKSLGEPRRGAGVLTIRCSIIGPDPAGRRGLWEWFLAQPEGGELVGYTDWRWNGVTTRQFAALCQALIAEDRFAAAVEESPVHHFCPNRAVSRYELLEIFREVTGRPVRIRPSPGPGAPAGRVLATRFASLRGLCGEDRDMRDAVRELVS